MAVRENGQGVGGADTFDAAEHAGLSARLGEIRKEEPRRQDCRVQCFGEVAVAKGSQHQGVRGVHGAVVELGEEPGVQSGAVGQHVHGVAIVDHDGIGPR